MQTEEMKIIKTKKLDTQSSLQKNLLAEKAKKAVKKAEKKKSDNKDMNAGDTETLNGLDIKTWETALKQLKMLLESPKEKNVENEPMQSIEKPAVKAKHQVKTKEIVIEINCDTSCDCCKKIAQCFENCSYFKSIKKESE